MAVQSTMNALSIETLNRQRLAQGGQNFECSSASPTMIMASNGLHSAIDLPLAGSFDSDTISIGHQAQISMHGDDQYGNGPCDGPSVWYCSSCGDGPMADWNPCCASCGHTYCGSCTVEST